MYELTNKVDFGNCTNILEIESEFKVSTKAGLELFKDLMMNYPIPDHLYRFVYINDEYCAIDEEIADLIHFLNFYDFPTRFSCAGHRTKKNEECQCYISFNRYSDKVKGLLSSLFKEITGESLETYKRFATVRIFRNKRYLEHTQRHVEFLESSKRRKYIVLNKRQAFFTSMSFEDDGIIRFNYKAERRMQSLLEFTEMVVRIGQKVYSEFE